MSPSPHKNLAAAFLGVIYGLVVAALAFIMGGGGHGWISSLISAVGVVLLPLALVAWINRWRGLLGVVLALGGAVDVALIGATAREGFEGVERTFAAVPMWLFAWGALWIFWQIALMIGFLRGTFPSCPKANQTIERTSGRLGQD